ncbi:hypothetical protein HI914_01219 [Erysiphe necator]|nr:hypothetical protein HI914_01219 [Erysiphe necator]
MLDIIPKALLCLSREESSQATQRAAFLSTLTSSDKVRNTGHCRSQILLSARLDNRLGLTTIETDVTLTMSQGARDTILISSPNLMDYINIGIDRLTNNLVI